MSGQGRYTAIVMPLLLKRASIFILTLLLAGCAKSPATTLNIGGDTRIHFPIKSIKAFRDENVVKQGYDYSCGAGALATLLSYGVGDKATEAEIMQELLKTLPKDIEALKKREGFSLADLQTVAKGRGHKAMGFRLAPEYLPKLGGPAIVFIKPRGYAHFAVYRGVKGDRVYLADPALGNVRMPAYRFLDMWLDENGKGVIFIVEAKEGKWPADYPLKLKIPGIAQPEVLTARQMLNTGTVESNLPPFR